MALLSSRLAPFSPASALSERIRSSLSFAFVSFDNSSSLLTLAPPFTLVSPVPAIDERGAAEDLRNFAQLYDRSDKGLDARPLESHPGSFDLALLPLSLIEAGGQLADEATTDVLADHAAIDLAASGVVVSPPLTVLPAHRYLPLRSRRARKQVTQRQQRHCRLSCRLATVSPSDDDVAIRVEGHLGDVVLFLSLRR